jgi:hypothetical protein
MSRLLIIFWIESDLEQEISPNFFKNLWGIIESYVFWGKQLEAGEPRADVIM